MSVLEPGMLVVCINAKPLPDCANSHLHLIVEGRIYTIRDVVGFGPDVGVRLEGIKLPIIFGNFESTFDHRRFRPCRKTSIELFEKMLFREPAGEDA